VSIDEFNIYTIIWTAKGSKFYLGFNTFLFFPVYFHMPKPTCCHMPGPWVYSNGYEDVQGKKCGYLHHVWIL